MVYSVLYVKFDKALLNSYPYGTFFDVISRIKISMVQGHCHRAGCGGAGIRRRDFSG